MTTLPRGFAVFAAIAALGIGSLLCATPSEAKNDKIRFRCNAETDTIQMHTRYEERTDPMRNRYRAQFEGSGGSFVAGAQLSVLVDSVAVGTITLVEEVPGLAEGQLRFDTKGRGRKVQPFPVDFPIVGEGSLVELQLAGATVIGCELN